MTYVWIIGEETRGHQLSEYIFTAVMLPVQVYGKRQLGVSSHTFGSLGVVHAKLKEQHQGAQVRILQHQHKHRKR